MGHSCLRVDMKHSPARWKVATARILCTLVARYAAVHDFLFLKQGKSMTWNIIMQVESKSFGSVTAVYTYVARLRLVPRIKDFVLCLEDVYAIAPSLD